MLFENSVFLMAGALAALIWANTDKGSYDAFIHWEIVHFGTEPESGEPSGDASSAQTAGEEASSQTAADGAAHHGLTVHFLVADILMALFFAIAAKEVWEAMLPGGALSNLRKAATPLLATLGGIVAPAGLYMAGVLLAAPQGGSDPLMRGWAVPCATDIAFSYLVARIVFGAGHPAIAFLLLLAIADDAAGLIILAVFFPQAPMQPLWLLLTVAAVATGFLFRKLRLHSFWWYLLIPGTMSWFSFYKAGIHPALGLVPIIPSMPHAHTDLGLFVRDELNLQDTLNAFEHWWKYPVEVVLGLFGLVSAGVEFSSAGLGTWLVLLGLVVGKPLGIALFTFVGQRLLRLEIPGNMNYRQVVTLGMVAGIGFTVALFVATAAFPRRLIVQTGMDPSAVDAVKMGALASFSAAILAVLMGWVFRVKSPSGLQEDEGSPDQREEAA
jgi:NhaA family Na+:H+ antiporter